MTPIDAYLSDLADQAGITIEYAHLRDGRDGEYVHERKLIRLRRGMSARKHRSVLAHELAHAAYGHTPTHFGPVHSKQERQADAWAARILIDLDDYRYLEVVHEGHPGAIAVDLGVMRSIVIAFQQTLSRIGQTTYVQPRMGAGGWAERIEIRESA